MRQQCDLSFMETRLQIELDYRLVAYFQRNTYTGCGLEHVLFSIIYGMSSFHWRTHIFRGIELTLIFFRGNQYRYGSKSESPWTLGQMLFLSPSGRVVSHDREVSPDKKTIEADNIGFHDSRFFIEWFCLKESSHFLWFECFLEFRQTQRPMKTTRC